MKTIKRYAPVLLAGLILMGICSCKKFLDLKPDAKLVIPKSLNDCQALLDDYVTMNTQYPSDGELASDNFYLYGEDYLSLGDQEDRDTYSWNPVGEHVLSQWFVPYQVVYNANLVLQTLGDLQPSAAEQNRWNQLKGAALFFRAYAFYQIAQVFAAPYQPSTASQLPGIPLRLSPDLSVKSSRGSLQQTYNQITADFTQALALLPLNTALATRPSKTAAYAALARTYLSMQNYPQAGNMASECLKLKSTLMDYNTVDLNAVSPFRQFNTEVVFQSLSAPKDALYPGVAKIDPELISSYRNDDLRLRAFFSDNGDGSFVFKGNYNGSSNGTDFFNGLATDEMYLVRAESYARAGELDLALGDLNTLLKNRMATAAYQAYTASSVEVVLSEILVQRRKELIARNLRWTDLRRLNLDPRFAVTLKRRLHFSEGEKEYTLPPNDLRYTFLIPQQVMSQTDLQQNPR